MGFFDDLKNAGSQIKSDFKHATGSQPYSDYVDNPNAISKKEDYDNRTRDSLQRMQDMQAQSRKDKGDESRAKRAVETVEEVATPAETFAANKKRYDDYMAEQEANARKAAQMDRATMLYEQRNMGAGPVPPQMQGLGAFQNPYMQQATSPAFNYAAQNYGQLGGMQRMYDRPKEMMSQRERQGVNRLYNAMQEPVPMPMQPQSNPYLQGLMAGSKGAGQTQPQVQSDFGRMLEARFGSGPSSIISGGQRGTGF